MNISQTHKVTPHIGGAYEHPQQRINPEHPGSFVNVVDSEHSQDGILTMMSNMTDIAGVLRILGALSVIAAMSVFLMQDWSEGNDISRYHHLLSQTILLAVAGLGMSYLMKENKSARLFFGLSLISVTVNMVTLSALIFSVTQWGSTLVHYPSFAQWQVADTSSILMSIGMTLMVSVPVMCFSYMVLARKSMMMLVSVSLCVNMLTLLPVRESLWVGAIAAIAVLLPAVAISRSLKKDHTLRTLEGFCACATLFVPAAIIIVRSIWLYPTDALLEMILAATFFGGLRFATPYAKTHLTMHAILNWVSIGIAFVFAQALGDAIEHAVSFQTVWSVFGIVLAGLILDVARRSEAQSAKGFAAIAAVALSLTHILPLLDQGSFINGVFCAAAGMAIIMIGMRYSMRTIVMIGGGTLAVSLVYQLHHVVSMIEFNNWVTLAILGVSTIMIASLIERHGAVIKLKWQAMIRS